MADEATTTTATETAATTTTETKAAETTQATETKVAETTQAETKPAETKTDGGEKAAEPIDYAKTIGEVAMPEGMTLDPVLAKAGGELFAKHNLSADAVKELVGMYAAQQKAGADGAAKAFADQVATWRGDAEKSTTPEERGSAKEAALAVFGKDEMTVLEHFGLTNRAGFIKGLAKMSKALKNDAFVPGNAGVNGDRDARSMFPNSNMNP